MKKIKPGMICAYDIKNENKKDVTDILSVEIISLVKRSMFNSSSNIWLVKDIELYNAEEFECEERFLTPTSEKTIFIIRNPIDMPVFNKKDLNCLESSINLLKSYNKNPSIKCVTDRLEGMREKILFCMNMREV